MCVQKNRSTCWNKRSSSYSLCSTIILLGECVCVSNFKNPPLHQNSVECKCPASSGSFVIVVRYTAIGTVATTQHHQITRYKNNLKLEYGECCCIGKKKNISLFLKHNTSSTFVDGTWDSVHLFFVDLLFLPSLIFGRRRR